MSTLSYCPMPHLAEDERRIDAEYRALMDSYLRSNHRRKVEVINRAYRFACEAHRGGRRMNGDPWVLHPLAVARIAVEEMGLGSTSICAALLHEVIENCGYTTDDVRAAFGDKIADIVAGLTRISGGIFAAEVAEQAANFRKLLLSMSADFRVLLVKMADRLHNLRTLGVLRPERRRVIASETLHVYAPLAHRLGLNKIKTELEDLSFRHRHPEEYADIERRLEVSRQERDRIIQQFVAPVRRRLDAAGLRYEIKARVKTPYSIYKKMTRKGIPFEEVYDVFAVRVIFDTEDGAEGDDNVAAECATCREIYRMLAEGHSVHPGRTRDWLTNPKPNGYRALHLTMSGPEGRWIEVQIRSRRMDEIAELGYAAHWKYKTGEYDGNMEVDALMNTIKEILTHPGPDELDFLETIRLSLFAKEIYVLLRDGELMALPAGSTVLDLAFAVGDDTGRHCVAGKIDHRLCPPEHKLHSGDRVEIITSDKREPDATWPDKCITPKAKTALEEILNHNNLQ